MPLTLLATSATIIFADEPGLLPRHPCPSFDLLARHAPRWKQAVERSITNRVRPSVSVSFQSDTFVLDS
jgi:hypothetical protein